MQVNMSTPPSIPPRRLGLQLPYLISPRLSVSNNEGQQSALSNGYCLHHPTKKCIKFCTNCNQVVCSKCMLSDTANQNECRHEILNNPPPVPSRWGQCSEHSCNNYVAICKSCIQFVCSECLLNQHRDCVVSYLRNDIGRTCEQLKSQLSLELESQEALLRNVYKVLKNKKKMMLKKKDECYIHIVRYFNKVKDMFLRKMKHDETALTDLLKKQVAEHETLLSHSIEQCARTLEVLTDNRISFDCQSPVSLLKNMVRISADIKQCNKQLLDIENEKDTLLEIQFVVNAETEQQLLNSSVACVEVRIVKCGNQTINNSTSESIHQEAELCNGSALINPSPTNVSTPSLSLTNSSLTILSPNNLTPNDFRPNNLSPNYLRPNNLSPNNLSSNNLSPSNLSPNKLIPNNLSPNNLSSNNLSPNKLIPNNLSPNNLSSNNLNPNNLSLNNFSPNNFSSNDLCSSVSLSLMPDSVETINGEMNITENLKSNKALHPGTIIDNRAPHSQNLLLQAASDLMPLISQDMHDQYALSCEQHLNRLLSVQQDQSFPLDEAILRQVSNDQTVLRDQTVLNNVEAESCQTNKNVHVSSSNITEEPTMSLVTAMSRDAVKESGELTNSLTEINFEIDVDLLDEDGSYSAQTAAASNAYVKEQVTADRNNERGAGELEADSMQIEHEIIESSENACTNAPERDRMQPSSPIEDENDQPPPYPGLPTLPMSPCDSPPPYPGPPPPPYTLNPNSTPQMWTDRLTYHQMNNNQGLNVESRRNNNWPIPIENEVACTFSEIGASEPNNTPRMSSEPNNTPRMSRSRSMLHFTVNEITDKRTTGVIALENVNGTDLLILDRWNRKLKYFNQRGDSIGGLIFREDPWDIAKISNDSCAVTVPKLKVIFKVNCEGDKIIVTCSLATVRKYACLTYYGGSEIFICGQVPQFGEPVIDLIGVNGGPALKTFRTDARTHLSLFSYPRYVKVTQEGIVIVCDWNLKCLLLFHLDGTFVGRYKGTDEYPLREPTGITYDPVQQQIYVIDSKYSCTEGTIHKVSPNGRCVEVIRSNKEFRFSRAICCCGDGYAVGSKSGVVSVMSFRQRR